MYYTTQNSKGETFYPCLEQMKTLLKKGFRNRFTVSCVMGCSGEEIWLLVQSNRHIACAYPIPPGSC